MQEEAVFTYSDLVQVVGAQNLRLDANFAARGVSTDTRTLQPNSIFVALKGENFDGHDHVENAFLKGASAAVVSEEFYNQHSRNKQLIKAPQSPLNTLGALAWYHRRRYEIPVIAIAGAAGKTSTKEIVAHVLSRKFNVLKTAANYNNQIGTPLTLLELTQEHSAAVVEIGTNQPGEIEILAAMVQPTHGLITNIGKEHLEQLIDIDGVETEERALFDYLHDHSGICFVNVDDERLAKYAHQVGRAITFGLTREADITLSVSYDGELNPKLSIVKGAFTFNATMQTPGIAAALNATCAVAIAWALGMNAAEVRHQLQSYQMPASHGYGRMNVVTLTLGTILNDTYNANPDSMQLALQTLHHHPSARKIAVLGDMLELGPTSEEEHMQVLDSACAVSDLVILYGEEFRRAADHISHSNIVWCGTINGCVNEVRGCVDADSVILVKGSRGMAMENVVLQLTSGN